PSALRRLQLNTGQLLLLRRDMLKFVNNSLPKPDLRSETPHDSSRETRGCWDEQASLAGRGREPWRWAHELRDSRGQFLQQSYRRPRCIRLVRNSSCRTATVNSARGP